jgi:hypothetical protein
VGYLGWLKEKADQAEDFISDFSFYKDTIEDFEEGNWLSMLIRSQPGGVFQSFFKDLTGFDIHGMWMNNPGAMLTTLGGLGMALFPPTSALGIGILGGGGLGGLITGIMGGTEDDVANSILFGGLGGLVGGGVGAVATRYGIPLVSQFLRSPWFRKWFPIGGSGAVTAGSEEATQSLMQDRKINWKHTVVAGLVGAVLGVGGGYFLEKATPPIMQALQNRGIIANADGTLSNPNIFGFTDDVAEDAADGYRRSQGQSSSGETYIAKKPKGLRSGDLDFRFETQWDEEAKELWATTSDGRRFKVNYGEKRNTVETKEINSVEYTVR